MRRFHNSILSLLFLIVLSSCEFVINDVPVPDYENSELKGSKKLENQVKSRIEGLYECIADDRNFGDTVVFKMSGDFLSVFTSKNTAYMVMESGSKNNDIIFEGYWRHANSDKTGIVQIKINSADGGKDLLDGKLPTNITATIKWSGIGEVNVKEVKYKRTSALMPKKDEFYIIAHKGGGRNIDRLPHSENTIELIEYSERLGANAVEIDVMLTKDNIPVLFHDYRLSLRTVNNEYLIGEVAEYTYRQLRSIAPLKRGEKIPSLDMALGTIYDKTEIKLVWLDVKNPLAMPEIVKLQKKYNDLAIKAGRQLEIFIGIPDETVYTQVKSQPDYANIPTLCELDETYVAELNSKIWAPRWSLGLLTDRVNAIHQQGKRAFIWTLDDPALIKTYIQNGDFDGVVTNFSPVVAYEYYTGKK
jgi:glycerophosphoryl diester phosphodiesterase